MSVIEIRGIRKFYGSGAARTEILHGFDLVIDPGEFVAITGPSGSGKSTLMNIIGLLDVGDEGTYAINGQVIANLKDANLADLRLGKIGFIFQNFNLISSLSVLDNLQVPMIYSKIPRKERRRRINKLLTYLGIADKLHAKPTELSGGQQQRVAIARALVQQPSLILADEPTGNLDTVSGQAIMDVLKTLNASGSTVLMITHDPGLATQAGRIITIRDGQIVSDTKAAPVAIATPISIPAPVAPVPAPLPIETMPPTPQGPAI
jgi:putative ABC transport system ATP-binding protein